MTVQSPKTRRPKTNSRKGAALALLLILNSAGAQQSYLVDWDAVGREAIDHLVELVKIPSVNPPGNETEVANYIQSVLALEGIESELYALDPARANLVARARGNGTKRPILIMGHTDVVGVQPDKWRADPFSGIREGGYIYGRGTLDDKDNVAAGMMVMILLSRLDVELDRDVIFLAEAGEEGTPDVGINFMVEKHWDLIAAEYCIAEGGQGVIRDGKVHTFGVETTEKMPRRVTLVARGTPGHGSVPRLDNAVMILANAVSKAAAWQTEMRLNETTDTYFRRMAAIAPPEEAVLYENVANPEMTEQIQQKFLETFPYHY